MVQRESADAEARSPRRVAVIEALSAGLCGGGPPDAGLLQQGLAMRDAVVGDLLGLPGWTIGVAGPSRRGEPLMPAADDTLAAFVRRTAQAFDAVWVIAPETDGLLASACAATPPSRWIGCSAAAIDLAASKSATLRCLAAAGVATPLAFGSIAKQWVVKPDDGAGAEATQRHDNHAAAVADLDIRTRRGEAAVLEPWIEGDALSISLHCTADAKVELLSVNRQAVDIDADGHVGYRGVTINALGPTDDRRSALTELTRHVTTAMPGLRGFVGIDLVWHASQGPIVIEVNPRTTSAYVGLSAALGRNIAAEALAEHFATAAHHAR